MMKRRGFTIIELLMVIAIIATLMGLVTTATVSAMRSSREKRAEAMRAALQAAIATYHAQDSDEKWPGGIESMAENGTTGVLTDSQAQEVFQIIVRKSAGSLGQTNPLIDPNGLFVAPSGVQDGKGYGRSYHDAIKGDERRSPVRVAQMVFGYQGKITGKFHRFSIVYNGQADVASVSKCCHECCGVNGCTKDGRDGRPLCPVCHAGEQ